jgi:putative phosphoesterase
MRLGVISDTHGTVRPEVFDVFADVQHILHAGDVGPEEILMELGALAPITAVFGNTDGFPVRSRCPQVARLRLEGFPVVVTHGDQFGKPTPDVLAAAYPDAEIIVFGHTHQAMLELRDYAVTIMNPGPAGPAPPGGRPSVGILELEAGIPPRARIVPL